MSSKSKILGTMRNTVLLSVLLGLTWITVLIPASTIQQYTSVILNASTGLYIFIYSVVANKQVMGEVRERVMCRGSEVVNTVSTAYTTQGSGSTQNSSTRNSTATATATVLFHKKLLESKLDSV